jgi:3-hydroxyisobutyrate dehydrogenase-like beta-hydroxyacid dehydrogenase
MPAQVDVIVLSLLTSQIVHDVVHNSLRLFETGREGLIVIDASTAEPGKSIELAARLRQKGIEMLDAPISGTSEMTAAKDTTFVVGGKKEIFERCLPIFQAMSRESVYMGTNGTGAVVKLVVNLVLALNRMALAEGLTLAKKAGLDQLQTLDVLKKSAAFSKAMDQRGERMIRKQFDSPIGQLAMHYKDVQLMLALAARLDCPVPLLGIYSQAVASEITKGRGALDSAVLISFYNELANI